MAQERAGAREESHDGYEKELADYERELARYLQARIKPGLSRGASPLLARSIARDRRAGGARADRGQRRPGGRRWPGCGLRGGHARAPGEARRRLDLRFSVHGGGGWLTAEKQDSSQRVEAPTAEQLVKIAGAIDAQGDDGAAADG
jgi:hypothetical protein